MEASKQLRKARSMLAKFWSIVFFFFFKVIIKDKKDTVFRWFLVGLHAWQCGGDTSEKLFSFQWEKVTWWKRWAGQRSGGNQIGQEWTNYLLDIVACLSTCFNEHDIQFPGFPFTLFSRNLGGQKKGNQMGIKRLSKPEGLMYLSFVRKICFIADQHDYHITATLCPHIINPLWCLVKGISICINRIAKN